jgi:hypothetical protein
MADVPEQVLEEPTYAYPDWEQNNPPTSFY